MSSHKTSRDIVSLSHIYMKQNTCCFLRTIGDRIGEGKASGNLGNTLKVLARFDEAVVCCQRHLDISQEQGDKVTRTFVFNF